MAMPGLLLLETLARKAAKLVPDGANDVADTVERARRGVERLARTDAAADGSSDELELAVGEALRAVVSLARHHGVDPEAAARRSAAGFRGDVEEALRLAAARDLEPAELDAVAWSRLLTEARDAD